MPPGLLARAGAGPAPVSGGPSSACSPAACSRCSSPRVTRPTARVPAARGMRASSFSAASQVCCGPPGPVAAHRAAAPKAGQCFAKADHRDVSEAGRRRLPPPQKICRPYNLGQGAARAEGSTRSVRPTPPSGWSGRALSAKVCATFPILDSLGPVASGNPVESGAAYHTAPAFHLGHAQLITAGAARTAARNPPGSTGGSCGDAGIVPVAVFRPAF